ncbi:MAG: ABC transporter permease [Holophagaceae bacterium]|nr:ABC transporter permease [Holophagaceae bacterium]
MLIHIAKKEIIEHIKSFRFAAAFLFILVTFFIMMFTRHFDYKTKYNDYLSRINAQEEAIDKYANYNRINGINTPIVPPSPLEIIVDPAIPTMLEEVLAQSLDEDPFNTVNINMDIISLVGLLGSLLALLLSYDSINREVNEGTIRLLLSSGVPRIKVILGKILGGGLAAILPITTIFAILSLWLAIGGQGWGIVQWMSLMGIFLVSIIYIMLFYCTGAFLSSVITDHTISALSCFGAWIMFVVIVPVISPYVAKAAVKIPNPVQMQRQLNHIFNVERDGALREAILPLIATEGITWAEAYKKVNGAEINRGFQEKANALQQNYHRAATKQVMVSVIISCVSPYSAYLLAVEELSCLGISRLGYLGNMVSNYRQKAHEYTTSKYEEARRLNPTHDTGDKLDLSGMPRFVYISPGVSYSYLRALPFILLLLAYYLAPLALYFQAYIRKKGLLRLSFVL